jgi:hypothetical protein
MRQLNQPKLVWFDEDHLRWKNVKWWHLKPIYLIVSFVLIFFAYLAGMVNARTVVKTEYIYFPVARHLEKQEGGGTHWVWNNLVDEFEKTQYKQPIQLIIK